MKDGSRMISKEERKRRNRRGGGVFLFFFLPGRIMSEESIFDLWFEGKPRVARDSRRGGRVSCALLGVIICKRRQKWIGKVCSSRRLKNPPFANAFFCQFIYGWTCSKDVSPWLILITRQFVRSRNSRLSTAFLFYQFRSGRKGFVFIF